MAAWVVSALRELPLETTASAAVPRVSDRDILLHPGLSHAERSRWLSRFRNADAVERHAVLSRFYQEYPHVQ
jgi:uncharacterized membrane protein